MTFGVEGVVDGCVWHENRLVMAGELNGAVKPNQIRRPRHCQAKSKWNYFGNFVLSRTRECAGSLTSAASNDDEISRDEANLFWLDSALRPLPRCTRSLVSGRSDGVPTTHFSEAPLI